MLTHGSNGNRVKIHYRYFERCCNLIEYDRLNILADAGLDILVRRGAVSRKRI